MICADIVGERSRLSPAQTAIVDVASGQRLTYREMDRRAATCARAWLYSLGLRRGDRLGILSGNRLEFLDAFSAAAKSGVILVPLGTRLTAAELAVIAADCRLSALVFTAAALFVPTANPKAAIHTALRDAKKHRSFNAGWPEAAMAGALGIALAGPRTYGGEIVNDDWMGDGRARTTHKDIQRALYLYGVACLITGGMVAGIAAARL